MYYSNFVCRKYSTLNTSLEKPWTPNKLRYCEIFTWMFLYLLDNLWRLSKSVEPSRKNEERYLLCYHKHDRTLSLYQHFGGLVSHQGLLQYLYWIFHNNICFNKGQYVTASLYFNPAPTYCCRISSKYSFKYPYTDAFFKSCYTVKLAVFAIFKFWLVWLR